MTSTAADVTKTSAGAAHPSCQRPLALSAGSGASSTSSHSRSLLRPAPRIHDFGRPAVRFDDGPGPRYTGAILDLLARHGATATFFAIGANVERHPELAARVVDAGHAVANHTHSHPRVERLPFADLQQEVAAGAASIEAATGQRCRWFRPPRGMVTGAVLAAAAAEDHDVTMWSVTRGGPHVPDGYRFVTLDELVDGSSAGARLLSATASPQQR